MGLGFKVKVKWEDIAKTLLSAGATAVVYKFSGDPATAATAGGYVKDVLDMVEIEKKEKSPAEQFGRAFEDVIRKKLNELDEKIVIKDVVTAERIIDMLSKLELEESVISDGNIDEINKAVRDVLTKNEVFVDNIDDEAIDMFTKSLVDGFNNVVLEDKAYLLLYTYKKVDKIDVKTDKIDIKTDKIDIKTDKMDNKIDKILESVQNDKEDSDSSPENSAPEYKLISNMPNSNCKEGMFTGRSNEIQQIENALKNTNMLFISGVGGVGKSELVTQYAIKHNKIGTYKNIIYMNYNTGNQKMSGDNHKENSGIINLILDLSIENYPEMQHTSAYKTMNYNGRKVQTFGFRDAVLMKDDMRLYISRGENVYEDNKISLQYKKDYYISKLKILKLLCDENVLLIIDNFNVRNDKGLKDIESIPCKKIFITKYNYKEIYAQIDLGYLEDDEPFDLFCKQLNRKKLSEKDTKDIKKILKRLGNHTTAIILIASQIAHSRGITITDMLKSIESEGINNVGNVKIRYKKDGKILDEENAFGHLCKLFNITKLAENKIEDARKKYILVSLSMIPVEGIEYRQFFDLCGLEEKDEQYIDDLIIMNWISESEGIIYLIPVIADVVFETAKSYIKIEGILKKYIEYYSRLHAEEKKSKKIYLEFISKRLININFDYETNLDIINTIKLEYARELTNNKCEWLARELYESVLKK